MTTVEERAIEVFISYRRKSWPFVHILDEELKKHIKGDVFVDYKGIDNTDFEQSIVHHLRNSDIVLVVVTELTFLPDRISKDDDWVRREIALALQLNKPIVLILVDNHVPPHPSELPEDIRDITRKQGIPFYQDYFDAGVLNLARFVHKVLAPVISSKEESSSIPSTYPTTYKNEPQLSASQEPQQETFSENSMAQEILTHHTTLEEIRKHLTPGKLSKVLGTTVEAFLRDIGLIFTYIENLEITPDIFTYIRDPDWLLSNLSEIMLELQTALYSWSTSMAADNTAFQRSEAFSDYLKHLNKCYGLLKNALDFFMPIV